MPETERFDQVEVSASVAVLLQVRRHATGLIMVRNGDLWGFPAGGLKGIEQPIQGLRRELEEETNITSDKVYFDATSFHSGPAIITPKIVFTIPSVERTQIGIIYQAEYHGPHIKKGGYPINKPGEKVNYVKPFTPRKLAALVKEHILKAPTLYKPEFTVPVLLHWLDVENSPRPQYVENLFLAIRNNVPGIYLYTRSDSKNDPFAKRQLVYVPPFGNLQDPEAEKRLMGRRWGS